MNFLRIFLFCFQGASSGIGKATAKVLAAQGYRVVVTARRTRRLEELVTEIEKAGGITAAVKLDVTSDDDYARAFGFAEGRFGAVNHVFLVKATQHMHPLTFLLHVGTQRP